MKYILFEWKLITRSRRLKQWLVPLIFFIPQFYLMHLSSESVIYQYFSFRIFFLSALILLPGATYSQFIFSTEASFMDKLMISPLSVYSILKAKYRLYCLFAIIMVIIFLPSMLLGVKPTEILSAFLYSIGFIYFACFQSARYNLKALDIKATKYYNWQGFSANQHIISFITLLGSMGIIFLIDLFWGENITLLVMSIIGIVFIVTNKFWLLSISRNFEKTKYRRLECFREK
jgi:hypothetical protein